MNYSKFGLLMDDSLEINYILTPTAHFKFIAISHFYKSEQIVERMPSPRANFHDCMEANKYCHN